MKNIVFNKKFLKYINSLTVKAPKALNRKQLIGEHQIKNVGDNDDFYDYRGYNSGDDLRHIDWNIFQRHKKLIVKRFHKQQHLKIRVVIDNSESLYFEEERIKCALKTALALCVAVLNSKFDVELTTLAGKFNLFVSHSNKYFLNRLISELPKILTQRSALKKQAKLNFRTDAELVFFISDFYKFRDLNSLLQTFNNSKMPIIPVRIYRKHDKNPKFKGNFEFTDCNHKDMTVVAINNKVIANYKQAYNQFEENLANYCKNKYLPIFALNADNILHPQLSFNFVNGCLNLRHIK